MLSAEPNRISTVSVSKVNSSCSSSQVLNLELFNINVIHSTPNVGAWMTECDDGHEYFCNGSNIEHSTK